MSLKRQGEHARLRFILHKQCCTSVTHHFLARVKQKNRPVSPNSTASTATTAETSNDSSGNSGVDTLSFGGCLEECDEESNAASLPSAENVAAETPTTPVAAFACISFNNKKFYCRYGHASDGRTETLMGSLRISRRRVNFCAGFSQS